MNSKPRRMVEVGEIDDLERPVRAFAREADDAFAEPPSVHPLAFDENPDRFHQA